MSNQYYNDPDEDDHIEDHDNKDWSKKGTPEGSQMGQKTTEGLMFVVTEKEVYSHDIDAFLQ